MGDYRDDLSAAHARIDALEAERADVVPIKTPEELEEEETFRDKLDDANARHPFVGWMMVVTGLALFVGATIRWCQG